ncbi:MAG: hypothetical protein PWP64_61 [Candidatus Cloacimonadota bacterium]|nr:hypothetical protein [Candidatus Cloacimonadota bacterium]
MKTSPLNNLDLKNMVELELHLHPLLEPIDLYKLLYQALYGPHHIIRDFKQLYTSINSELGLMQENYEPLFQEIGPYYSRLSLSAIKKDGDTLLRQKRIEALTEWIMASSCVIPNTAIDFVLQWKSYEPMLKEHLPADPPSWAKADQLAEQNILPSHSDIYRQNYHPHYRLINPKLAKYKQKFMELNA